MAAPTTTTARVSSYASYPFTGVATEVVIARYADGTIAVASITSEANWVSRISRNGPRSIEIEFFNRATQQEAQFAAELSGGQIKVSKES